MFAFGFGLFSIFIIALELFTGFAVIGWTGDNMLVERARSPGPYWFAIVLHVLIAIGLPALIHIAT
ncbi:MAG: hypothetical protein AAF456_18525 [Planctomycetota bacterium]